MLAPTAARPRHRSRTWTAGSTTPADSSPPTLPPRTRSPRAWLNCGPTWPRWLRCRPLPPGSATTTAASRPASPVRPGRGDPEAGRRPTATTMVTTPVSAATVGRPAMAAADPRPTAAVPAARTVAAPGQTAVASAARAVAVPAPAAAARTAADPALPAAAAAAASAAGRADPAAETCQDGYAATTPAGPDTGQMTARTS